MLDPIPCELKAESTLDVDQILVLVGKRKQLSFKSVAGKAARDDSKSSREVKFSKAATSTLRKILKKNGIIFKHQTVSTVKMMGTSNNNKRFDIGLVHPEAPNIAYLVLEVKVTDEPQVFQPADIGQAMQYIYHELYCHSQTTKAFCILWNFRSFKIICGVIQGDKIKFNQSEAYSLGKDDVANWTKFFEFCTMKKPDLYIPFQDKKIIPRQLVGIGGSSMVFEIPLDSKNYAVIKIINKKDDPVLANRLFKNELAALNLVNDIKGTRKLLAHDDSRLIFMFDYLHTIEPVHEQEWISPRFWVEFIDTLKAFHEKKLVNRDIRLCNLLVDVKNQHLVLSDFGTCCWKGSYDILQPYEAAINGPILGFSGSVITASDALLDSLLRGTSYAFQPGDDLQSFVKTFFLYYYPTRKSPQSNSSGPEDILLLQEFWKKKAWNPFLSKALEYAEECNYFLLGETLTNWASVEYL